MTDAIERLETTFGLHYTWDYGVTRKDLRDLYEKSKEMQWNGATYLPWNTDVDISKPYTPDAMIPIYGSSIWRSLSAKERVDIRVETSSWLLSQFLHGEQGALLASAQLVTAVPSADAKFYASTQVMDEARHVEVYDRYIREKVGFHYPVSPHLKQLLDTILTDSRWDMKYLGMQIMVEGLALAAFGFIHKFTDEPLLRELTKMVMRDEARHVAFGVLGLRDVYKNMPPHELRDREDFVIEASRLMRDRFLAQEVWEKMALPVDECMDFARTSPPLLIFRSLLFSKIVPYLKRLGLLTPYVRPHLQQLGVLQYENADPDAEPQDIHSFGIPTVAAAE